MSRDREWQLIRECRRGRVSSFEPLVLAYQGEALTMAESLLADRDEAADAVQDAFVKAYRGLGRLAEGSAFGPWFRTILRNLCLDRLRSPARRARRPLDESVEQQIQVDPVGTARLEQAQLAGTVHVALRSLPHAHREVLVLKEIECLTYAEIAQALSIPPGTVASRVFHARAALKRALVQAGVGTSGNAS